MARKVFISVLGTGVYRDCVYKMGEFESRSKFIQQSTLEFLQRNEAWGEDDQVCILLTQEAKGRNWEACKDFNGFVLDPKGLKQILLDMKEEGRLNAQIREVEIKDGKDENELWDVFNTLYGLLEDGDELYFDLTHGFRYLPMLVLVFGNYAKLLKHATIKSITYGNYEMSERGTKPAPIFDLLPLSQLQDWTFATAKALETGDIDGLDAINGNGDEPIMGGLKMQIEEAIKRLKGNL